ncbi:MAG: nicotinate (nicotinamide) nucleotide adenylyltransferase [Verrucomicrobiales bacterium]
MNSPPSIASGPGSVCLFGGSFDPVHCGHVALAEAAYQRLGLDSIVFVPCRQSPFKVRCPIASAEERVAMLRLAVENLPWALVSTCELERQGPSFAWETAQHFAGLLPPGTRIFWLLGADQWVSVDRWARPDLLKQLLSFVVFPRGDIDVTAKPGFSHTMVEVRHHASSTMIREAVAARRSIHSLVAGKVAEYIAERGLYLA